LLNLIVQPAQNALAGARMVVLHEVDVPANRLIESLAIEAFEEEASRDEEERAFR
jgi:hypothetical protein